MLIEKLTLVTRLTFLSLRIGPQLRKQRDRVYPNLLYNGPGSGRGASFADT